MVFYLMIAFGVFSFLGFPLIGLVALGAAAVVTFVLAPIENDLKSETFRKNEITIWIVTPLLFLTGHWIMAIVGIVFYLSYIKKFEEVIKVLKIEKRRKKEKKEEYQQSQRKEVKKEVR